MIRRLLGLALLIAALAGLSPAPAAPPRSAAAPTGEVVLDQARCEALAGGRFQDIAGAPTWITSARLMPATPERQAVCAIAGYVNPNDNFGMYLPAGHWNGRYIARGCGGSCGVVATELACGRHARDGYACLITDMGHSSTIEDNNWVQDNLRGLVEFGYRATHVTAIAGKAILAAFYGMPARKSYFLGCSTGGRQALIEAERFPQDFDGIVAIAPASMAPYGVRQDASVSEVDAFNLGPGGRPILPNRKAVLIHQAVVNACDMNDGVKDGLIGDPRQCRWEPEDLACKTRDSRSCLTPAQIAVVHNLYRRRGLQKGSELNWIGNYLRNAPLPGEPWQPLHDLGKGRGDPATIQSMIDPNNPDLRPFRDQGGRLILVQGWSDPSVMPLPTLDYYETVTRTMGGLEATQRFARLFMIPGMNHCSGGEGAGTIDYLGAITAWVDSGDAPDKLRGVHPVPGAPIDYFGIDLPRLGRNFIAFERDHYAWPKGSVAIGRDTAPTPDRRPLSIQLSAAIADSLAASAIAGFPNETTLNALERDIWALFDRTGASADAAQQALDALRTASLPPIAHEAVTRLAGEMKLD